MRRATTQRLEAALATIDVYFVETAASHDSDSGTMWELAVCAREAIALALVDEGLAVSDAPWATE